MKAKLTMMFLLLAFFSVSRAQDSKIIVWLNDGGKTEVLFNDMPEFVYQDGNVTLTLGTTQLSWPLGDLQKFTFEVFEPDPDDIKNLSATGEKLDLVNGGTVYDLSGKLLKKHIKSLSELPKGTYIVNGETRIIK